MGTTVLVTGGAGFIGSNLVRHLLADHARVQSMVVLDRLTYAGNLDNLASVAADPRYTLVVGVIFDRELVWATLDRHRPQVIFNLAAESHVDRSIDSPGEFVRTNVTGTFELLEGARALVAALDTPSRASFRFIQVSTDEVFGSLGDDDYFSETTRYAPSSPYAASKAAADHLVRAYFHTYGLPTLVTHCSNNFGPFQFPEKLIPLVTLNALEGAPLPVYGDGKNVRDWLYVTDHCQALELVARHGRPGETYCVGGNNERTNIDIVEAICAVLDARAPRATQHRSLISFVRDRPGHDRRYAIDSTKIRHELGWAPATSLDEAIRRTVDWYIEHRAWCDRISIGAYRRERLGLGAEALPTKSGVTEMMESRAANINESRK
ncbi:MAG: dTDP-glucose 4,6-dehydratase [Polyangiales bacterium]